MSADQYSFEVQSILPNQDSGLVWRHMMDWGCINEELWPLNMSHPDEIPSVDAVPADAGVDFVSKVKLGGMPVDLHHFAHLEIVEGLYLFERSSTVFLREWTHRRAIKQVAHNVVLTDTCTLTPKFGWLGRVLAAIYHSVFIRRHDKLRRKFGACQ